MNKKRKYKYAAMTTALLIIALIIIVNLIFGVLSSKMSLSIDLTKDSILKFSDVTNNTMKKLNMDVKIISLIPSDDTNREMLQIDEILKKYAAMSDKITYERADAVKNPGLLTKYTVDGKPLQSNYYVIFETDRMYSAVDVNDMFVVYKKGSDIMSGALKAEQSFTSAIVKVTEGSDITAYVCTGHGENMNAETLKGKVLADMGYNFKDISLMTDDIPKEADLIIIYDPSTDYSADEIEKIAGFSKGGGSIQVFLSPENMELTNLFGYLGEWGVSVGDGLVGDNSSANYVSYRTYLLPTIVQNDITKTLGTDGTGIMFPLSRPVSAKSKNGMSAYTLAETSSDAYVKADIYSANDTYESGDKKEKSSVAVLISKAGYENKSSMLFVSGSSKILGDYSSNDNPFASILDITGNRKFYSGLVAYMTNQPSSVYIAPKNIVQDKVVISQAAIYVYAFVSAALIPVIILAAGFIIWARRRHL